MTRRRTTSGQWNNDNPERVQAARMRYQKREKKRRAGLTDYTRAKEDVAKIFGKLTPNERKRILAWWEKQIIGSRA